MERPTSSYITQCLIFGCCFLVGVFFRFIVLSMGENFWLGLTASQVTDCLPVRPRLPISGYVECCFPRFQAALQTDAPVWMSESRWKEKSKKNLNRSLPTNPIGIGFPLLNHVKNMGLLGLPGLGVPSVSPTGDFLEGINADGSNPHPGCNGHHQDDIAFLGSRIRS